jgi:hypothetical protein
MENITLKDFIKKCMTEKIGQSDMHNFVQMHTNNFNTTKLELLKNDLNDITKAIKFTIINEVVDDNGAIEQKDKNTTIEKYIENHFDFSEIDVFDYPVLRNPRAKLNFVINDIEERGLNFEIKGYEYKIIEDDYIGFFKLCDMVELQYLKMTNPKNYFLESYGIMPEMIPKFKEMQYRINSEDYYKEKQNLVAAFYNTFSYFKAKFNIVKDRNNGVLPDDVIHFLNEMKNDFKTYFPKNGRIENVYYFDDIIEMYLNSSQKTKTSTPPPPKPFAGLLIDLSDKQLDKLFVFLTTENKAYSKPTFIDKETDRQSFDYIFGGIDKPNKLIPIEWQANNQWLREILAGLQIEKTYHKVNNTLQLSNEIERQTSDYFTKKGEAINITSTKQLKDKPEYKAISKFLATI